MRARSRIVCLLCSALVSVLFANEPAAGTVMPLPSPFREIVQGPAGGSMWQGVIGTSLLPEERRPTLIYLPPRLSPTARDPVVYLLHGFPGSPYEYVFGLQLPDIADRAIAAGRLPPFVAVIPPAGLGAHYRGEWTGVWEDELVRVVVPWVDAHLPTIRSRAGRTLAGLSAGGYGAVDIGLRHPRLFRTLESWSGTFFAPRDGSLAHASRQVLAAHDPSLLVRHETRVLRRLGTRFFLSSGTTRDPSGARAATAFAEELDSLGIPHRLWLGPGGHNGRLWRAQLPDALRYALLKPGT